MAAVVLYNDINFGGDSLGSDGDIFDLSATNYNDQASSIVIHEGTWTFCTDADMQGTCQVLGPGNYGWVEDVGIPNDTISSLKRVG